MPNISLAPSQFTSTHCCELSDFVTRFFCFFSILQKKKKSTQNETPPPKKTSGGTPSWTLLFSCCWRSFFTICSVQRVTPNNKVSASDRQLCSLWEEKKPIKLHLFLSVIILLVNEHKNHSTAIISNFGFCKMMLKDDVEGRALRLKTKQKKIPILHWGIVALIQHFGCMEWHFCLFTLMYIYFCTVMQCVMPLVL